MLQFARKISPCDLENIPQTDTIVLTSTNQPIIAQAEIKTIDTISMISQNSQRLHRFDRKYPNSIMLWV